MSYFAGNRFGDEGLQQLIKSLPTLSNLRVLDVSSNSVTATGVSALSEALSVSAEPGMPLQVCTSFFSCANWNRRSVNFTFHLNSCPAPTHRSGSNHPSPSCICTPHEKGVQISLAPPRL